LLVTLGGQPFFGRCVFSLPMNANGRGLAHVFFTLDLPPMPEGLAGFNRKKIALRPLLPTGHH